MSQDFKEGPRIYNLFPRLVGPMSLWPKHFGRMKDMGFNWVFINSVHYPGFSGSLYAVKHHYVFNPMILDEKTVTVKSPEDQFKQMIKRAHDHNIKILMDLIINHTSLDHPLTEEHPEWYKHEKDGKIKNPGAWDGPQWVTWGDLAEIDNEASKDKENLWKYWSNLMTFYLKLGIDGFRCDAAYKIPAELWEFLIGQAKDQFPEAIFVAETLGCPIEQTIAVAKSGFDYVFNSSKYWDFKEPWCIEQYNKSRMYTGSISFTESHDTSRLADDLEEDWEKIKMRYLFSALFSAGVMIPIGFEYGFRKRLHVVNTIPQDWEDVRYDLSSFIQHVNALKQSYRVFNEDNTLEVLHFPDSSNPLFAFMKTSFNHQERAIIFLNSSTKQNVNIDLKEYFKQMTHAQNIKELSPENPLTKEQLEHQAVIEMLPSQVKVFYGQFF